MKTATNYLSQERKGELFIASEMLIYSLYPILISYSTKILPPILFVAISVLMAGVIFGVYMGVTRQFGKLKNTPALKNILGIVAFIIVIPSVLIFLGTSKTSGINTSLLLQSELIFTFVLYWILKYEKITAARFIGAMVVLAGTIAVLYTGSAKINIGDLLIIAGTFFYPIGNIYTKKALKQTSPVVILFCRNFLGGIILLLLSLAFESYPATLKADVWHNIHYILFSGIVLYSISKLFWYEGIKRLDINKAIVISIGGYPAISMFFAYVFLKEIPTLYQWIGFVLILAGLLITIKKPLKEEVNIC